MTIPVEVHIARFHASFERGHPDECWEWQGTLHGKGYGATTWGAKGISAHRLSYILEHGSIPDGQVVRHTCDNKPCVNPRHLILGTRKDNARDAVERGRMVHGSDHPAALLDDEKVRLIWQLRAAGWRQREMAEFFGVTQTAISSIVCGRNWKHVERAA